MNCADVNCAGVNQPDAAQGGAPQAECESSDPWQRPLSPDWSLEDAAARVRVMLAGGALAGLWTCSPWRVAAAGDDPGTQSWWNEGQDLLERRGTGFGQIAQVLLPGHWEDRRSLWAYPQPAGTLRQALIEVLDPAQEDQDQHNQTRKDRARAQLRLAGELGFEIGRALEVRSARGEREGTSFRDAGNSLVAEEILANEKLKTESILLCLLGALVDDDLALALSAAPLRHVIGEELNRAREDVSQELIRLLREGQLSAQAAFEANARLLLVCAQALSGWVSADARAHPPAGHLQWEVGAEQELERCWQLMRRAMMELGWTDPGALPALRLAPRTNAKLWRSGPEFRSKCARALLPSDAWSEARVLQGSGELGLDALKALLEEASTLEQGPLPETRTPEQLRLVVLIEAMGEVGMTLCGRKATAPAAAYSNAR